MIVEPDAPDLAFAAQRAETTYTGKCLAEIRERAGRGALGEGPILFWNTFSSVDVKQSAPRSSDAAELPRSLRQLFERHHARPLRP